MWECECVCVGFPPRSAKHIPETMRSHSRLDKQKNKQACAIDPRRPASQTGWVSLLWIRPIVFWPLDPGRGLNPWFMERKGQCLSVPCSFPPPPQPGFCLLAGPLYPSCPALAPATPPPPTPLGLRSKTSRTDQIRILRTAYCPSLWACDQTQSGGWRRWGGGGQQAKEGRSQSMSTLARLHGAATRIDWGKTRTDQLVSAERKRWQVQHWHWKKNKKRGKHLSWDSIASLTLGSKTVQNVKTNYTNASLCFLFESKYNSNSTTVTQKQSFWSLI